MKSTFLLACLFCIALPAVTFADGATQYPDYNFAISPPKDWVDTTADAAQKGVIASFGSPDHTRAVFVLVEDRAVPIGEWDDALAAEFDRTAEPNLGKRLSGEFVSVQGIKSYERTSAPVVQGKTISMISRTTPVGTRFYSLQGYHFAGGNAGEDPQVREFLESFRFLTPPPGASSATDTQPAPAPVVEPPPPPATSSTSEIQPTPAPAEEPPPPRAANTTAAQPAPTTSSATDTRSKDLDDAFKRGQSIGRMMAFLLIVGVPTFAIVWFVRRGKRRAPGVPHPPPPSPQPQSATPPHPPAPTELRPPPPPAAQSTPLPPARPAASRAAPPARPVSPPTPPTPPMPFSAPLAPVAPPSAAPAASPSPAPSQAPQPRPFVIRPRQRHMRG